MDINFLVIEGNIGVGKTTLAEKISSDYNAKLILERFADNPFLPKFYDDPEKYSFPLEMSFMADRYNQLKRELTNRDLFCTFTVADYYFMKSLIFSRSTLNDDEYALYRRFFEIIYDQLPKPDLYVYLHASSNILLKNIAGRGRDYEINIDSAYLEKIHKSYLNFMKQQKDFPVVIIDTHGIDFVNNRADYKRLISIIFENDYKNGINNVRM
ncbi:deoxynucleoside kinase [Puteibacter caeruleilacunae]|nr:deoxynucleoside kinase [Puteibacter caeruleilacunae]